MQRTLEYIFCQLVITGVIASTVQLTDNTEAITEEINCNSGEKHLRECLPDVLDGISNRTDVAVLTCSAFTAF